MDLFEKWRKLKSLNNITSDDVTCWLNKPSSEVLYWEEYYIMVDPQQSTCQAMR